MATDTVVPIGVDEIPSEEKRRQEATFKSSFLSSSFNDGDNVASVSLEKEAIASDSGEPQVSCGRGRSPTHGRYVGLWAQIKAEKEANLPSYR